MDYRSTNVSRGRQLLRSINELNANPQGNPNRTSVADRFLSQNKLCRLNVDDAVIVLRNLTQTSFMDSPRFSMKDVQPMVDDRKVRSFHSSHLGTEKVSILARMGDGNTHKYPTTSPFQRPPARGIGTTPLRNRPKRSLGNGEGANATCFDYGETGHHRGENCCKEPSAFTRKKNAHRSDSGKHLVAASSGPGFFAEAPGLDKADELNHLTRGPIGYTPLIHVPKPNHQPGMSTKWEWYLFSRSTIHGIGMPLHHRPLDRDPFLHGYGEKCTDAQVTIGVWDLPFTALSGVEVQITLYVTRDSGFLLVGSEILHQSYQLGPESLLVIPPNFRSLSTKEFVSKPTRNRPLLQIETQSERTSSLFLPIICPLGPFSLLCPHLYPLK